MSMPYRPPAHFAMVTRAHLIMATTAAMLGMPQRPRTVPGTPPAGRVASLSKPQLEDCTQR